MSRCRSFFGSAALVAILVLASGAVTLTRALAATPPAPGAGPLSATAGCGKAPTLASGIHTVQSNGKRRSYILRVPDGYDSTRQYRLIFAFHWVGGTANDVASGGTDRDAWAYYGLMQLSNNSTILVAAQLFSVGFGYAGCRAGYPVTWAAFDGGHTPGPVDGGGDSGVRTWTKGEVWNFFSQFQSQPPSSSQASSTPAGSSQASLRPSGSSPSSGVARQRTR